MSRRLWLWHLQNVTCPWHLRMSYAPDTWISSLWSSPCEQSSHWCSPHKQSSHIHRSASLGMSEITSLYRWGGTVLPMLRSSIMESQPWAICHTGLFKHSTLSVPIGTWQESSFIYSWYTQFVMATHTVRVTALHCLLKVEWLGARKMSYVFVLLSLKEINFCMTSDVMCWVATLCQLMVLLDSKLMEWWGLTTVHLPWAPHWVPEFFVMGVTLLCEGEAHALGPQQWWTDNSKAVSIMLDNIYSL